jgi:hypothetical protein
VKPAKRQPQPARLVVPARPALVSAVDLFAIVASGLYYAAGMGGLLASVVVGVGVMLLGRLSVHRTAGASRAARPAEPRTSAPHAGRVPGLKAPRPPKPPGGLAGRKPAGLGRLSAVGGKAGKATRAATAKARRSPPGRIAASAGSRLRRPARTAGVRVARATKGTLARAAAAGRTRRSLNGLSHRNSAHGRAGRRTWADLAAWRSKARTRRARVLRGVLSAGAAGTSAGRAARGKRKVDRQRGGWRRWVGVDEVRPQKPAGQTRTKKKRPADKVRPAGPDAKPKSGQQAAPAPAPQPAVNHVTGPTRPTATGTGAVRTLKFHQSAQEMAASAQRYTPEDMQQVYRDMTRLPEALGQVAAALRIITQRAAGEWPLRPAVIEAMGAVHGLLVKASESSAQVAPAMRRMHADDLARYEQPRKGERLWNVPGR